MDNPNLVVVSAMAMDESDLRRPAWGCIVTAIAYAANAAHRAAGDEYMSEIAEVADSEDARNDFALCVKRIAPRESFVDEFMACVRALPSAAHTRSKIVDCVTTLAAAAPGSAAS